MKKHSGFTLIELIILMAIIAILAVAGLTAYTGYIQGARDAKRVEIANQMKTIAEAQTTISGAPDPAEFEAYLTAEGIAWNVPIEEPLLARVVESLAGVFGISDALALIKDPAGGRAICLDHTLRPTIVCQFVYYRFSDGTYAISYGVEKAANLVNPHYARETGTKPNTEIKKPRTYGSFIGNSSVITATATDPTLDIEDQEVPAIPNLTVTATSLSDTGDHVNIVTCGGATCGSGQGCSANDVCTDLCGGVTCGAGQGCSVNDVCTDLCGGVTCGAGQGCGANDVCVDLCGEVVCGAGTTCVNDICTAPNSCAGKSVGQACDGTTALYAGAYDNVNYQYMIAPSAESITAVNWSAAQTVCPAVTTYGFTGEWRLPTSDEQIFFWQTGLIGSSFWEWSSTATSDPNRAYGAYSGAAGYSLLKADTNRVRCVRRYPCSSCSCPAGKTNCGGSCKITSTDNTNCGGCGIVCSGGSFCTAGVCADPCATKSVGQVCNGTTAKYGGVYNGQKYMIAPGVENPKVLWLAAQTVCPAVTTYGYTGEWRLPTSDEQIYFRPSGLIGGTNWEWSSTADPSNTNNAYGAYNAVAGYSLAKTQDHTYARCVRTYQ